MWVTVLKLKSIEIKNWVKWPSERNSRYRYIVLYYQISFLTSFTVIIFVELEVFLCYDAFVITMQIILILSD